MLEIGVPALRIMSLVYLFAGVDIVCITVFQALGNGAYGLTVSLLRQLCVLLPVAYLFAKIGGLTWIWSVSYTHLNSKQREEPYRDLTSY